MSKLDDKLVTAAVLARVTAARADLAAYMSLNGLREEDGWRVSESIRPCPGGSEFVFRPIHLRIDQPEIEFVVRIDTDGNPVS